MRLPGLLLLLAVVVTGSLVTAGVATGDDQPAETAPKVVSTPLADYDTTTVTVPRAAFCAAVPAGNVEEALDGPAASDRTWVNGDPAPLTDSIQDVAHEYGCAWVSQVGATARAWVFAPPVDPVRAATLVRMASRPKRCDKVPGPAYGDPSVALICSGDGQVEASYRGLFGDAWLTCTVTVPAAGVDRPALQDRAGRWCVAVANAAAATPGG